MTRRVGFDRDEAGYDRHRAVDAKHSVHAVGSDDADDPDDTDDANNANNADDANNAADSSDAGRAGRADNCFRDRRRCVGGCNVDRAGRYRHRRDQWLHRHVDAGQRLDGCHGVRENHHGDRTHERHELHVRGEGEEQRRQQCGVCGFERRNAAFRHAHAARTGSSDGRFGDRRRRDRGCSVDRADRHRYCRG